MSEQKMAQITKQEKRAKRIKIQKTAARKSNKITAAGKCGVKKHCRQSAVF